MIGMRYNQVLENLGNMQIRREYLLVSGERETQYFEVGVDIDLGVMRIRDYASQNPKVLIECHRHHSFSCRWALERPESLDYLTRPPKKLPIINSSQLAGFSGTARVAVLWPMGPWPVHDECFYR